MQNMKSLLSLAAITAVFALASCGSSNESVPETNAEAAAATKGAETTMNLTDGNYTIDAVASTIAWKGSKITGSTHVGTLAVYKGSIEIVDQAVAGGFVSADMNAMVCTDEGMDDDTKANLIGHLQSDDFFGVEQHPFATVSLEGIKVKGDQAVGFGKLTIRDITQPISFPVTVAMDGGNVVMDAQLTFDRAKHNVKFRSGAFPDLFPDLGDNLINDEIELDIHIVASL